MTRLHALLAAALLPLVLLVQPAGAATTGSGRSASESRSVAPFRAIATQGALKLMVRQAATQAVQVQADDNLLALVETVVEDGPKGPTLRIGVRRGESIRPRSEIVVRVDVVSLERLAAAGSGGVQVEGLSSPSLEVSLSGSSEARLRALTLDRFSLRISGSSEVAVAGRARSAEFSIAGSGDIGAHDLLADEVAVRIAGSGDASVNASRALSVSIAGSGDVSYAGNPALTTSVAGSGSIKRR